MRIALTYKDRAISFDFAALDYNAPENQIYAYKMEGQDADWIQAGTRRHVDYTNLRGGEYVFRVIAANSDSVWNTEGTSVFLDVAPPWWSSWIFRLGSVAALALLLLGGYRWRMQTVESRSRELENLVAARTREVETRRRVAESLRDVLQLLNSDRSLDQILRTIVEQACELERADAGVIYRYDDVSETSSAVAMVGMPYEFEALGPFRLTGTEPQRAVAQRQPHSVPDFGPYFADVQPPDDPTLARWLSLVRRDFHAKLTAPIIILDKLYGALELYYRRPRTFSEDVVNTVMTIGTQAALAIENARLRETAEQAGVSAERNRIARELHDSVSQALYGIVLGTRTARTLLDRQPLDDAVKASMANPLDYVFSLADAGLAEMRALIFELRPDALEKEGLIAALTKQADAIRTRHRLVVETDVCDEPTIALAAKEALYRVAQEALNNLVKHAQATEVVLRVVCSAEGLVLEVRDNGVGFDPQGEYPGHLGLQTMRERVARLGGRLVIESAPGQGTLVRATLPLNSS